MSEPAPAGRSSLTTFTLVAGGMVLLVYGLQDYFFPPPAPPADETVSPEGISLDDAAAAEAEAASRAEERRGRHATATIRTDQFEAEIDNLGGGIESFRLLGDRYAGESGEHLNLVTTNRDYDHFRPLRIELPGAPIPADAVWEITQESETSVVLRWEGEGLVVTRRFEAGTGPYQIWQTVNVRNVGTTPRRTRLTVHAYHYVERAEESSGFMGMGGRSPLISEGLCRHDEEIDRKDHEALLESHGYGGDVDFVGIESTYFVTALAPGEGDQPAERCGMYATDFTVDGEVHGSLFHVELKYPETDLDPGSEHNWRVLSYVGPKDWSSLQSAGHSLEEVVNLGTFAIIARAFAQLLAAIHGFTGNWGLAIILLTLMVRIALFPLMERQFRSMAPMRKLKPELDEIGKRFPDDLEKRQAAQMELYRKHGINPASQMLGCLPLLLQMPVFFALYTSLSTNVELYHQPFALWWTDLSAPDPFFVLPLLLVALMHLQQRLTPNTMDPQQARIMMVVMPIMMGVFMLFLPSGLCLYMLTNSVLGIGQQQLNLWRTAREDAAAAAKAEATAVVAEAPAPEPKKSNVGGSGRRDKRRPSRG